MALRDLWLGLLSTARRRAVILAPADSEIIAPPDLGLTIYTQRDQDGAKAGEVHGGKGGKRAIGSLVASVDPGILTDGCDLFGTAGVPPVPREGENAKLVRDGGVGVAAQIHTKEVKLEAGRRSKLSHANLCRIARCVVRGRV